MTFVRADPAGVGEYICSVLAKHGIEALPCFPTADNRGAKGWMLLEQAGT